MSNKNVDKLISNKEEAPIGSVKLFECEKKTSLLALCVYFQSLKLLYFTHNKSKKTTSRDGQNNIHLQTINNYNENKPLNTKP